ncbi:MAG TPA: TonB-dependent receptor [Pyrinomonadaceae bacterium]|nr:TonB-dependent receptor [Pyrinomonadaceae bacterium]
MKVNYLFKALLFCLFATPIFAQNSAISGKITDQNGSVVSGATVKVKNSSGSAKTTVSNSNGEFEFSNLTNGDYQITVEKTGFEKLSQEVSSGQQNLVLTLKIGSVGATVEVASETYTTEEANTATKLNVPLKDVPQSVQVVNQNILRDRATFSFSEAVTQNVSGITRHTTDLTGSGAGDFLRFRGFSGSYNNSYLRDGLKQVNYGANETADVERIEVLKGAASVLYGRSEPGGVVNLVSKQPVSDNFISFDFTGGQFNFYRPQVDAGGKVFSDKLLYRLNFAYQYDGNFREDADGKRVFVAPVLLWKPTEKLQISFDAEYLRERRGMDVGQLLVNGRVPDVPVERSYGEPFNRSFQQNKNGGIRGRYDFNSNWSVQSAYRTQFFDYALFGVFPALYFAPPVQSDGRTVNRDLASIDFTERWHYSDSNISGRFSTGKIKHNILGGFEYGYTNGIYNHEFYLAGFVFPDFPTTDIFTPTAPLSYEFAQNYIRSTLPESRFPYRFGNRLKTNGVYVQDLIEFTPKFKVLIGGRYDIFKQRFYEEPNPIQLGNDKKFSPRVGFVYQPLEYLSFYASYGNSFSPQFPNQRTLDNRLFKPSVGEQFEGGVKLNSFRGKLSGSLAFYNLTFTNLVVSDPNNPGTSIQTGEQRSRGIELDVSANPIRGLNLIGSYSAIQATVTKDTDALLVGRFLPNTARHNGNFWATYRFVEANNFWRNFGVGAGLQAVGKRFTNLANFGVVPGFSRVDASTFYDFSANEKTQMRFAVNLQNLTNKRYYESAFGFNDTVYPGSPFRALFSLKITRR